MAKTAAEYQRDYRDRKKLEAKLAGDPVDAFMSIEPFSTYVQDNGNWQTVCEALESVGITPPTFDADNDPQWEEEWGEPYRASIGRAERMVGAFLDAAMELSGIIADHKRHLIDVSVERLQQRLSEKLDADTQKLVVDELVRLSKLRERLDRRFRRDFADFSLKGGV